MLGSALLDPGLTQLQPGSPIQAGSIVPIPPTSPGVRHSAQRNSSREHGILHKGWSKATNSGNDSSSSDRSSLQKYLKRVVLNPSSVAAAATGVPKGGSSGGSSSNMKGGTVALLWRGLRVRMVSLCASMGLMTMQHHI